MTLHVDNPDNIPEPEVAAYVRRAEERDRVKHGIAAKEVG